MTPAVAKCLLVSKVLVADGMMGDDEKQFLDEVMDKLELSADEKIGVIDLEGWDEAEGILAGLSNDEKLELVELLVDAASADGHLSPKEMAQIKGVEQALGIK
ncbi:MAG: TerB family tellurite resistance protein [Kofleriaceae bacterium]